MSWKLGDTEAFQTQGPSLGRLFREQRNIEVWPNAGYIRKLGWELSWHEIMGVVKWGEGPYSWCCL